MRMWNSNTSKMPATPGSAKTLRLEIGRLKGRADDTRSTSRLYLRQRLIMPKRRMGCSSQTRQVECGRTFMLWSMVVNT
eukprot:7398258-Karenia_brevis.AAC.1